MKNQKQVIELIKSISGQANVLTIPRIYLDIFPGDHVTALFLSQCVYWSDRTSAAGGWFWKSYREWQDEIGITQHQAKRAADTLKEAGVLDTKLKRANSAPTVHYQVNFDALIELITGFFDNQESRLSKNRKSDYEEIQQSDYEESSQSLTETTIDYNIDFASAEKNADDPEPPAEPKPRPEEARRKQTAEAMMRGLVKHYGVTAKLEHLFRISPNWNTKTAREFIQWLKLREDTQPLETFARWWYKSDFRGQRGQPPTLAQIRELYPQAFTDQHDYLEPEPVTYGFVGPNGEIL